MHKCYLPANPFILTTSLLRGCGLIDMLRVPSLGSLLSGNHSMRFWLGVWGGPREGPPPPSRGAIRSHLPIEFDELAYVLLRVPRQPVQVVSNHRTPNGKDRQKRMVTQIHVHIHTYSTSDQTHTTHCLLNKIQRAVNNFQSLDCYFWIHSPIVHTHKSTVCTESGLFAKTKLLLSESFFFKKKNIDF